MLDLHFTAAYRSISILHSRQIVFLYDENCSQITKEKLFLIARKNFCNIKIIKSQNRFNCCMEMWHNHLLEKGLIKMDLGGRFKKTDNIIHESGWMGNNKITIGCLCKGKLFDSFFDKWTNSHDGCRREKREWNWACCRREITWGLWNLTSPSRKIYQTPSIHKFLLCVSSLYCCMEKKENFFHLCSLFSIMSIICVCFLLL